MSVLVAACTTSGSGGGDAAGYNCKAPPADLASCATDADCSAVASGCFCGAQPVNGVAVSHAATAQTCEAASAAACALGCANAPGFRAQDGKHADASAMILVRCDKPTSAAGTCTTYVP
jgi:hypothetical protein